MKTGKKPQNKYKFRNKRLGDTYELLFLKSLFQTQGVEGEPQDGWKAQSKKWEQ